MKRPVGAAGLLISMTERQLHSQGGIEKGKLRLLRTPLGCGQVVTGVATHRKKDFLPLQRLSGGRANRHKGEKQKDRKGEGISAECRALQGATTAPPARGRSFHVSAWTRTTDSTREMEELEAQATPLCKECK